MSCKKIQNKLAVLELLNITEADHIQSCPNCKSFSEQIKTLHVRTEIVTNSELRRRTFEICSQYLEEKEKSAPPSLFRRLAKAWYSPFTVIILGLVMYLFLTITPFVQYIDSEYAKVSQISTTFLLIITIQNFIMALCLPILFQNLPHKFNLILGRIKCLNKKKSQVEYS